MVELGGRESTWGCVRVLHFSTVKDDDVAFGNRDASVKQRDVIVYTMADRSLMINGQSLIRSKNSVFFNILSCDISHHCDKGG